MRRRRIGTTSMQRLFVALILATVFMFILTEIISSRNVNINPQPPYVLQKTYYTAECMDKRLGNAMFIYAALVGIAKRVNASMMIQKDCLVTEIFRVTADIVTNAAHMIPMHDVYEEFGRRASAFDIKTDKLKKRNTILKGYFQSWRYFRDAFDDVRSEFSFQESTENVVRAFFYANQPTKWKENSFVRVGIHVRRGDILTDYFKNYGYTAPDRDYFQHAMTYFRERYDKVQFIVCSDDIMWAIEHIKSDHMSNVIYSQNRKDYEDMAILSHCDHAIISVGSFGWWAGWLTNGTTIYYAKWPKEYSKLEYHVQKRTYFPPEWIPME